MRYSLYVLGLPVETMFSDSALVNNISRNRQQESFQSDKYCGIEQLHPQELVEG